MYAYLCVFNVVWWALGGIINGSGNYSYLSQ